MVCSPNPRSEFNSRNLNYYGAAFDKLRDNSLDESAKNKVKNQFNHSSGTYDNKEHPNTRNGLRL